MIRHSKSLETKDCIFGEGTSVVHGFGSAKSQVSIEFNILVKCFLSANISERFFNQVHDQEFVCFAAAVCYVSFNVLNLDSVDSVFAISRYHSCIRTEWFFLLFFVYLFFLNVIFRKFGRIKKIFQYYCQCLFSPQKEFIDFLKLDTFLFLKNILKIND
uniref:Uncharacterized protein n=1 Tax=Cacopsylla melanoneura TaxID=428564 RepID=A0A8D9F0Z6_9HEMI